MKKMICLDLGCGDNKKNGYIGIDKFKGKQVDIVLDLEKQKLPFEDNSVDKVYTRNVLERLSDITFVMNEIHRVLKQVGEVEIIVHYFRNPVCHHPLYKLYFNWASFDYFLKTGRGLEAENLRKFKIVKKELLFEALDFYGLIPAIAKRNYYVYERFLSHFFPAKYLYFVLKKESQ